MLIHSNRLAFKTRKDVIANAILAKRSKTVGIYRLVMKEGLNNMRAFSMQGGMKQINAKGTNVAVCEPTVTNDRFLGSRIGYNLKALKEQRDVIIANWHHVVLSDLQQKVYPRHYLGRRPEPTRLGSDTMHQRRQKS